MWYDHIRIISGILGQDNLEHLSMLLVKPGRLNISALCPSDMKSSVRKWHGRKQGWENRRKEGWEDRKKDTEHKLSRHFWRWGMNAYCCLVTQSRPTLWNPMDYSLLGSSVHEIFQARIMERVVISFPRGFSQSRVWTLVFSASPAFQADYFTTESLGSPSSSQFHRVKDKKPNWTSLTIYKN